MSAAITSAINDAVGDRHMSSTDAADADFGSSRHLFIELLGIGEIEFDEVETSTLDDRPSCTHPSLFMTYLGVIGPILIDEIDKYIRETNHSNDVHSLKISHIGRLSPRTRSIHGTCCCCRWAQIRRQCHRVSIGHMVRPCVDLSRSSTDRCVHIGNVERVEGEIETYPSWPSRYSLVDQLGFTRRYVIVST